MEVIATLTHAPEHCWARPENDQKAREWVATMEERATELDVTIDGAYVTPIEHRFYFVLESDSFEAVSTFLGPPILTDLEAHIAPVTTMGEAISAVMD